MSSDEDEPCPHRRSGDAGSFGLPGGVVAAGSGRFGRAHGGPCRASGQLDAGAHQDAFRLDRTDQAPSVTISSAAPPAPPPSAPQPTSKPSPRDGGHSNSGGHSGNTGGSNNNQGPNNIGSNNHSNMAVASRAARSPALSPARPRRWSRTRRATARMSWRTTSRRRRHRPPRRPPRHQPEGGTRLPPTPATTTAPEAGTTRPTRPAPNRWRPRAHPSGWCPASCSCSPRCWPCSVASSAGATGRTVRDEAYGRRAFPLRAGCGR